MRACRSCWCATRTDRCAPSSTSAAIAVRASPRAAARARGASPARTMPGPTGSTDASRRARTSAPSRRSTGLRGACARGRIGELRATPEDQWDLIPYSAVICVVFPNTVFVMQGDHLETWHVFPAGDDADRSVMYVSLYTPEEATTGSARRHWDRNMDLL